MQARFSLRELVQLQDQMRAELVEVNRGSDALVAASVDVRANAVELQEQEHGSFTASQREFIERYGKDAKVRTGEKVKADRKTYGCNSSGFLHCDPPARGGTHYRTADPNSGCTTGFFVRSRSDSSPYLITAGHCYENSDATGYYANNQPHAYGLFHRGVFDARGDMGIIQIRNSSAAGWNPKSRIVQLGRTQPYGNATTTVLEYEINSKGSSVLGGYVCATGGFQRTTQCGTVQQLAYPRTAPNGATYYVVRTNICVISFGDSGGPVYVSNSARGLIQGPTNNNGTCDLGYMPILEAENTLNVDVVVGSP